MDARSHRLPQSPHRWAGDPPPDAGTKSGTFFARLGLRLADRFYAVIDDDDLFALLVGALIGLDIGFGLMALQAAGIIQQ